MQLKVIDNILINIYNIRNLTSVKFWDMLDVKDNQKMIIPALMITYDGGKQLNITSKEKYFDVYVRKVTEVYNDENNNILEGPFGTKKQIEIDERSKSILESKELTQDNKYFNFYKDKKSYDNSLLFQNDDLKGILPIITYHLKKFYDYTNHVLTITENWQGYRDNYIINGKLDGLDININLFYQRINDNKYKININFLDNKKYSLVMNINFNEDAILVNIKLGPDVEYCVTYKIISGIIKEITEVKKNSRAIQYENRDLPITECPYLNISNLDYNSTYQWFKLPWNAYYGVSFIETPLDDYAKIIENESMYLLVKVDSFYRKDNYVKKYLWKDKFTMIEGSLIIINNRKSLIGLPVTKELYVIESAFADLGSNNSSIYLTYLNHKYFYHIALCPKGIKDLEKNKLKSINQDDDILSKADVINTDKLLILERRK